MTTPPDHVAVIVYVPAGQSLPRKLTYVPYCDANVLLLEDPAPLTEYEISDHGRKP